MKTRVKTNQRDYVDWCVAVTPSCPSLADRRIMKSYRSPLPKCLMVLTMVLILSFALCGCQKPVKMSQEQAQTLLEEELSNKIPEDIKSEFGDAKPIVKIYDMDIPNDNNGTYDISCSCSIDMGEIPADSYWKGKSELLESALKSFNETAEGIKRLGNKYSVDISAHSDIAFFYDSVGFPYTVESDMVFRYTSDLSSGSVVYDARGGADSSSGSESSKNTNSDGSSTFEGPTGTFVKTDDGDVVQFGDNGSVTQYNENGITTFNSDGSKEWTDGWGTVVQDVDGDGSPDRISYDSGETWVDAG